MKTLLITRHGKTIPWDSGLNDFDRYLTSRGHKDPVLIYEELMSLELIPDIIISSPAKRAIQTAEIFAKSFQIEESDITKADFLYGYYSTSKLIEFLSLSASELSCVQLVAHNPKMEELAADLTASVYRRLPTSGTIVLEFDIEKWDYITKGSGTMVHYITAKSLRE